jgi:DNA-binding transcriptional LysR family regulator
MMVLDPGGVMSDLNLRYFFESAKLGSMRAAADKLGIAVSSISRQIAQLEADLGVALIEHGRRTIKLTEAGELLLEYYGEQTAQREVLDQRLADLKGLRSGRIDLVIGEGFISQALSAVLSKFMSSHAGILMQVRVLASSNEVARLVVEDDAHLGLTFDAGSDPRARARVSIPQPLRAIMRPGHPLADRAQIRLADLVGQPVCLPEASLRTRQLIKLAEDRERISLQAGLTANSVSLLRDMALSTEYVTLLPVLAVASEVARGELIAIPIDNPILECTRVNLLSRLGRQLAPAPTRLLSALEAYLNKTAQLGMPAPLYDAAE